MLPKIAAREAQLRDLLTRGTASENASNGAAANGSATTNGTGGAGNNLVMTESDRQKADKLIEKIKHDYQRADEWNAQKEALAKGLWRNVCAHQKRLSNEVERIAPHLVQEAEQFMGLPSSNGAGAGGAGGPSSSAATGAAILNLPSLASLPAALAGLRSPAGELTPTIGTKRKAPPGALTPTGSVRGESASRAIRPPSADRSTSQGGAGASALGVGASPGSASHKKQVGRPRQSGLSNLAASSSSPLASGVASSGGPFGISSGLGSDRPDGEGEEGGEEKDETLYCHCQRVSFGEMIGCDSNECPYEWFHISCVGVSKPLPQTWYCSDCKERMEKEKADKSLKKRKRQSMGA